MNVKVFRRLYLAVVARALMMPISNGSEKCAADFCDWLSGDSLIRFGTILKKTEFNNLHLSSFIFHLVSEAI